MQTVASAGGTLSAIIFVLPGLVMIGWWQGFPFWTTFLICALGGMLGVLFSIPLRRALVVNSPLPFPEGVAAAEVLKVGATGDEAPQNAIERKRGPLVVLMARSWPPAMQIVTLHRRSPPPRSQQFFRVGAGVSGDDVGLFARAGGRGAPGRHLRWPRHVRWARYRLGRRSCRYLSAGMPGDIAEIAETAWRSQVRFIGAGAIGVAAIWSLLKLVKPVFDGMVATMRAAQRAKAGAHRRSRPLARR